MSVFHGGTQLVVMAMATLGAFFASLAGQDDAVSESNRGLPAAELAQAPVDIACLPSDVASEAWADLLFQDEKEENPWDPETTIRSCSSTLLDGPFCTSAQVPEFTYGDCGRANDSEFLSISQAATGSICTSHAAGGTSNTNTCATGTGEPSTQQTLTGLIISIAKDGTGRTGFVCTSMGSGSGQGSNFCGISSGSGVASTWNTSTTGGWQWCSVDASADATNSCTAKSGATGWCSVSVPQEHNAKCTAQAGSQGTCSTIGGGTSRCSAYQGPGMGIAPPVGGVCTAP